MSEQLRFHFAFGNYQLCKFAVLNKFQSSSYIFTIIGAIDATNIRLANNPQEEGTSYINPNGIPGVSLQVVCDANRRILDARLAIVYARLKNKVLLGDMLVCCLPTQTTFCWLMEVTRCYRV